MVEAQTTVTNSEERTANGPPEIEVIGAGFGRTGTLSLKTALEQLGFNPCCHMLEIGEERAALWLARAEGVPVSWRDILKGYRATVDWPGCAFYEDLMTEYPLAKVILTTRDPEAWYESASKTIHTRPSAQPAAPDDTVKMRMIRAIVWNRSMQGAFEDRRRAIDIFVRHVEEVKRRVPPNRLLIFDVREGWEPLCAFLGRPVPTGDFPRVNDRATFNDPASFERLVRERTSGLG